MTRRTPVQSPIVAAITLFAILTCAHVARAQSDPQPAFEVATLKQAPPEEDGATHIGIYPQRSGDSFTWCTFLGPMLSYAYNVPRTRIEGFKDPGLAYTVTARLDPSSTEEQARLMLRGLLVARMKMTAHRESRKMPGYALVVGKKGPKMHEADASGNPPPMPDKDSQIPYEKGRIFTHIPERGVLAALGGGVPMSQLADELSKDLKTPVVDRTGLTGKYYFELKFQMPDAQLSASSNEFTPAADISSALPDQLGLKLEKQKVSAEFLVVEHFEAPTPE